MTEYYHCYLPPYLTFSLECHIGAILTWYNSKIFLDTIVYLMGRNEIVNTGSVTINYREKNN